jgi:hypothetical protein
VLVLSKVVLRERPNLLQRVEEPAPVVGHSRAEGTPLEYLTQSGEAAAVAPDTHEAIDIPENLDGRPHLDIMSRRSALRVDVDRRILALSHRALLPGSPQIDRQPQPDAWQIEPCRIR